MTTHCFRLFLLMSVLLSVAVATQFRIANDAGERGRVSAPSTPLGALTRPRSPAILFADGVSIGKWLSGGRSRVVQLCMVAMCVALFIMMRKLN